MSQLRELPQRFWDHIDRTETCWLWTGSQTVASRGSYGRFSMKHIWYAAHRLSYEAHVGPIPEGLSIDHLCRVHLCVNPAHLEAVTLAENARRAIPVVTHCPRGHEYNEVNAYLYRGRSWRCRPCRAAFQREYNARDAALKAANVRHPTDVTGAA